MKIRKLKNGLVSPYCTCILILMLLACSKDNSEPMVTEQIYLPKTVSLAYSSGDTVSYEFSYNSENQMTQLIIARSPNEDAPLIWNFSYDDDGQLTRVIATDPSDGFTYEIRFNYDDDGVIAAVPLFFGNTEYATTVLYNPDINSYGITGDLGNLPTSLRFDETNHFVEMYITTNHVLPKFSDTEKGIFYEANMRPAHHIWFALTYYLVNYELSYFSKKDIEQFTGNGTLYTYQNKVRDSDGNLETFQMDLGGSLTIDYVISYE